MIHLRRIHTLALILLCACSVHAESESHRSLNPHELSIGWGDQLFERTFWHESPLPVNTPPDSYYATYKENMRYTQHIFVQYQYRQNSWFSYGGMIDCSGVLWDNTTRNGSGYELAKEANQNFFNIVLMPSATFTYFHHPYVSMHAAVGVGLNINTGTETNYRGQHTVCAPAFDLTVFGVRACYQQVFVGIDLGAMVSLRSGQEIFMFGSRLLSAYIGVTF